MLVAGCGEKKVDRKKVDDDDEERKPRFSSAELTEAKNSLGAIARGAVGAFEREHITLLCQTGKIDKTTTTVKLSTELEELLE